MTKATTSKTDNANVTQAKINGPKAAAMSSDTAKAVTKQTLVLNLLTRADPLGAVTTYTYDTQNNLTSATDPLGRVITYTASGLPGGWVSIAAPA